MQLSFVDGRADIKNGRKVIASIIDRAVRNGGRYASQKYPYNLEIPGIGIRECESLQDAIFYLNKYTS